MLFWEYCCMCQVEDNTRPHQINLRGPSLLLLDAVEMSTTVFFFFFPKSKGLKLDFMLSIHTGGLHNCAEESYVLMFSCLENKHSFMNDMLLALIFCFANVFNSLLHES